MVVYPKKKGSDDDVISLLNQLIVSLEQAEERLEVAYKKEKHEQFREIRDFMLKMQKRISDIVR
jgi:hypothetical protein